MKTKTIAMMSVALACGLLAAYMTSQLIADKKEKIEVLMAKAKYSQWTTLQDPVNMFDKTAVPKGQVRTNYIPPSELESLKNRRLKLTLEAGATLTYEDLLPKAASALDDLPHGKRAMAVPIDPKNAVSGFVVPGSHVDLIHIKGGISTLVLKNILVRTVDLRWERPETPGIIGSTATLQVDLEQALKLAAALETGTLKLILRPDGEPDIDNDRPPPTVVAVPAPPPLPETRKEEIRKETKTTTEFSLLEEHQILFRRGSQWDLLVLFLDKERKPIQAYIARSSDPNRVEAKPKLEPLESEQPKGGTGNKQEKKPKQEKPPEKPSKS